MRRVQDDYSHAQLCEQFKARSVSRTYVSLSCGVPSVTSGRIEVPIARDVRDRKRMAAVVKSAGSRTARLAASRYCAVSIVLFLGQSGIIYEYYGCLACQRFHVQQDFMSFGFLRLQKMYVFSTALSVL